MHMQSVRSPVEGAPDAFCPDFTAFQGQSISGIESVECVWDSAFEGTAIEEIAWPKNCKGIPMCCFCRSKLKAISGIENVEWVSWEAFASCLQTQMPM